MCKVGAATRGAQGLRRGEANISCPQVVYEDGLATTLTVGQLEAMEGRREWLQDVRLLQSVVAFATPRIGIFPRQIEGADADEVGSLASPAGPPRPSSLPLRSHTPTPTPSAPQYASLADPDFPLHSVSESLAAFLDETLNRVHFPPFDARAAEETAKRALELAGVHHDRRVWHRVTRSVFEGADPTQARGAHTGEKGGEDNAEAEEAAETEAAAVQRAVEAAEKQHVVEVAYARKQSAVSRRRVASLVLMFQTDADSTLWCIGAREFVVAVRSRLHPDSCCQHAYLCHHPSPDGAALTAHAGPTDQGARGRKGGGGDCAARRRRRSTRRLDR